eukprot:6773773-Karenia_brevis.AAC.1
MKKDNVSRLSECDWYYEVSGTWKDFQSRHLLEQREGRVNDTCQLRLHVIRMGSLRVSTSTRPLSKVSRTKTLQRQLENKSV